MMRCPTAVLRRPRSPVGASRAQNSRISLHTGPNVALLCGPLHLPASFQDACRPTWSSPSDGARSSPLPHRRAPYRNARIRYDCIPAQPAQAASGAKLFASTPRSRSAAYPGVLVQTRQGVPPGRMRRCCSFTQRRQVLRDLSVQPRQLGLQVRRMRPSWPRHLPASTAAPATRRRSCRSRPPSTPAGRWRCAP